MKKRLRAGKHILIRERNHRGCRYYRLDKEDPIDILEVDNTAVRLSQIRRLEKLRNNRDNDRVRRSLEAITKSMETGEGNVLALRH